jgi:hypothetical protein
MHSALRCPAVGVLLVCSEVCGKVRSGVEFLLQSMLKLHMRALHGTSPAGS